MKTYLSNIKGLALSIFIITCTLFIMPSCSITYINGTTYLGVENVMVQPTMLNKKQIKDIEAGQPNLELGVAFKVQCHGFISSINITTPVKGNVTLHIWDYDNRQLIQSIDITINNSASNTTRVETKIQTEFGKTYAITYNTRSYYYFPINTFYESLNNQKLLYQRSVFSEGKYSKFPSQYTTEIYHGIIDIGFHDEIKKNN